MERDVEAFFDSVLAGADDYFNPEDNNYDNNDVNNNVNNNNNKNGYNVARNAYDNDNNNDINNNDGNNDLSNYDIPSQPYDMMFADYESVVRPEGSPVPLRAGDIGDYEYVYDYDYASDGQTSGGKEVVFTGEEGEFIGGEVEYVVVTDLGSFAPEGVEVRRLSGSCV
jgi:hypothetical protein